MSCPNTEMPCHEVPCDCMTKAAQILGIPPGGTENLRLEKCSDPGCNWPEFCPVVESEENLEDTVARFASGATRSAETLFDPEGFLSPEVLRRFCQYMEKHRRQADGEIRSSDNWQKGMSRARYMRSLLRHVLDLWSYWRLGKNAEFQDEFEDLLCAVMFNVQGLLLETIRSPRPLIRSEEDDA